MQEQEKAIAHIRSFNRFYTHILGLLNQHILDSDFSLTEARVMLEISKGEQCQPGELADRLKIDRSYLSRILKRLEGKALLAKTSSPEDSRVHPVQLTAAGRAVLCDLDGRSQAQIYGLIQNLSPEERASVQNAMSLIREQFVKAVYPVTFRGYQPGDEEYIIQSHSDLYLREYGLSSVFATYVDGLVRNFVKTLDPTRECVIIPEADGRRLGSIAIAKADDQTAQLRYFLLEPEARGYGLGLKLTEAALAFARQAGYKRIFLETISLLTTARTIYRRMGFAVVHTNLQSDWGREVLEERWEMEL